VTARCVGDRIFIDMEEDKRQKIEKEFAHHQDKMQKMEERYKWLARGSKDARRGSAGRNHQRRIYIYAAVIILATSYYMILLKQNGESSRQKVNAVEYFFPKNMSAILRSEESELPITIEYRHLPANIWEVREIFGQSDLVRKFQAEGGTIFQLVESGGKKEWSKSYLQRGDLTMGGAYKVIDINVSVSTFIGHVEECLKVINQISSVVEVFCRGYGKTSSTNFDYKIRSIDPIVEESSDIEN